MDKDGAFAKLGKKKKPKPAPLPIRNFACCVSITHKRISVRQRFPHAEIGKDHNKADALNIALYARQIFDGK